MTIMVLLVLAAVWAAVLLPPYLQKRRAFHPSSSIVDFQYRLDVLERTGDPSAPRPAQPSVGRAMSRVDAQRRRRDVLTTLVAAAGLTLLLALVAGGAVWLLHLTVDAALLGYVAMLLQVQGQRQMAQAHRAQRHGMARRANVYDIDALDRRPSATQQALLRRQAN